MGTRTPDAARLIALIQTPNRFRTKRQLWGLPWIGAFKRSWTGSEWELAWLCRNITDSVTGICRSNLMAGCD